MSVLALSLIFVTLIIIVSQFGSRLAARNSLTWWIAAAFIMTAAVSPRLFTPIISSLGIQVVSNFVLAVLIMFLFMQVLELTAELTIQSRRNRQLISGFAADAYIRDKESGERWGSGKASVLIVLPTYNEEEALPQMITDVKSLLEKDNLSGDFTYHACFVDDGSADASFSILRKLCPRGYYAHHRINIGVSGVLLTDFEIAKTLGMDYVVQCDSDGQHPVAAIPELVAYAKSENLDLLVGSRFTARDRRQASGQALSTTRARVTGIQLIRKMLILFGHQASIYDPTSGFRVYSRSAQKLLYKSMPDEYPEPESLAILSLRGARIGEHPVAMLPRSTGISSINGFKTIRFMVKVMTALLGLRLRTLWTLGPSKP